VGSSPTRGTDRNEGKPRFLICASHSIMVYYK